MFGEGEGGKAERGEQRKRERERERERGERKRGIERETSADGDEFATHDVDNVVTGQLRRLGRIRTRGPHLLINACVCGGHVCV